MSFTHRVIKNKSKVKNHVTPICATSVSAMLTLLLLAVSYCACPTQPEMRSTWSDPARHAQWPLRSKRMTSASKTPEQNVWSGFTLVSESVSCCHAGKCILVLSKDLLTKYIVFCSSILSGYLTHVVEWTGAIWPSSGFRSAVVVPRIFQAEKLDSCGMNHSEYLQTLTLCPAQ